MHYIITNPSQEIYIRLDKNGRPETCNKYMAQQFQSVKAKNILENLPRNLKQFHFMVQGVLEIPSQVDRDIVNKMEKNIISGNVDYEVQKILING